MWNGMLTPLTYTWKKNQLRCENRGETTFMGKNMWNEMLNLVVTCENGCEYNMYVNWDVKL